METERKSSEQHDRKYLEKYYRQVKQSYSAYCQEIIDSEYPSLRPILSQQLMKGKHLRPFFCYLISELLGGDKTLALRYGAALELIHSGTLIHDDWIDGDIFRRAVPTLWKKIGSKSAVLIADIMLAKGSFLGAHSDKTAQALSKCIYSLALGAYLDFNEPIQNNSQENQENQGQPVSFIDNLSNIKEYEQKYIERIRKKTAVLYSTAAEIATYAAQRSDLSSYFIEYGDIVGILYQLTDDFIDIRNSSKQQQACGDLQLGISSLPLLSLQQEAAYAPRYASTISHYQQTKEAQPFIEKLQLEDLEAVYERLYAKWHDTGLQVLEKIKQIDANSKQSTLTLEAKYKLLYLIPRYFSEKLLAE